MAEPTSGTEQVLKKYVQEIICQLPDECEVVRGETVLEEFDLTLFTGRPVQKWIKGEIPEDNRGDWSFYGYRIYYPDLDKFVCYTPQGQSSAEKEGVKDIWTLKMKTDLGCSAPKQFAKPATLKYQITYNAYEENPGYNPEEAEVQIKEYVHYCELQKKADIPKVEGKHEVGYAVLHDMGREVTEIVDVPKGAATNGFLEYSEVDKDYEYFQPNKKMSAIVGDDNSKIYMRLLPAGSKKSANDYNQLIYFKAYEDAWKPEQAKYEPTATEKVLKYSYIIEEKANYDTYTETSGFPATIEKTITLPAKATHIIDVYGAGEGHANRGYILDNLETYGNKRYGVYHVKKSELGTDGKSVKLTLGLVSIEDTVADQNFYVNVTYAASNATPDPEPEKKESPDGKDIEPYIPPVTPEGQEDLPGDDADRDEYIAHPFAMRDPYHWYKFNKRLKS